MIVHASNASDSMTLFDLNAFGLHSKFTIQSREYNVLNGYNV